LIADQFLEGTASQLTYHGLCELNAAMGHDELAVLFRNNHFSTILKKKVNSFCCVRAEVLTLVMLKIQVLWDVILCHQESGSWLFKGL
jgi:hypothetical protein